MTKKARLEPAWQGSPTKTARFKPAWRADPPPPSIPTLSDPGIVPGSKTATGWRGRVTAN